MSVGDLIDRISAGNPPRPPILSEGAGGFLFPSPANHESTPASLPQAGSEEAFRELKFPRFSAIILKAP